MARPSCLRGGGERGVPEGGSILFFSHNNATGSHQSVGSLTGGAGWGRGRMFGGLSRNTRPPSDHVCDVSLRSACAPTQTIWRGRRCQTRGPRRRKVQGARLQTSSLRSSKTRKTKLFFFVFFFKVHNSLLLFYAEWRRSSSWGSRCVVMRLLCDPSVCPLLPKGSP